MEKSEKYIKLLGFVRIIWE